MTVSVIMCERKNFPWSEVMNHGEGDDKLTIGWREWVSLPGLGIPAIKAKIDTGARTSVLHAFTVRTFRKDGRLMVRFGIHPLQRRSDVEIFCVAEVFGRRLVSDSGGHLERRIVIRTPLQIGRTTREVEMTLTRRETMLFRMLLGRTALGQSLVDPTASYLTGRGLARSYRRSARERERR